MPIVSAMTEDLSKVTCARCLAGQQKKTAAKVEEGASLADAVAVLTLLRSYGMEWPSAGGGYPPKNAGLLPKDVFAALGEGWDVKRLNRAIVAVEYRKATPLPGDARHWEIQRNDAGKPARLYAGWNK